MPSSLPAFPLADADRCVKCGLCLPHCPTYALTQHEGDSPRGRIALMQGLATGLLAPTPALEQHLDGCLSCRSCEPVCPAQVPYGSLIDAGRTVLNQTRPQRQRALRWLLPWLTQRTRRRLWLSLLWSYQRSGLQTLLRRAHFFGSARLARLDALLPPLRMRRALCSTAPSADAQLFVGCTGDWADRNAADALLALASALGRSVDVPATPVCCGALQQHAGLHDDYQRQRQHNHAVFGDRDVPILSLASGCAATLREGAPAFAARVTDACTWVLAQWRQNVQLRPWPARVALHTPCTQRNVLRQAQATRALLAKIPGLELHELQGGRCCGAAGAHMMQNPTQADALLESLLDAVEQQRPDAVITTNIGCSLHLAAGLRRRGLKVPVLHPLTLLARQLSDPAPPRGAASAGRQALTAGNHAGDLP